MLSDGTGRAEYVLDGKIVVGRNELVLTYASTGERGGERADCVLLKGGFSVSVKGEGEYPDYYVADGWTLTGETKELDQRHDPMRQGRYFYAGEVLYEFGFDSDGGDVEIGFSAFGITACDVHINGKFAFTAADLSARYPVRLKKGANVVKVCAHTTDANVYGPFHNVEGYPKIVSPYTYEEKWGVTENIFYPEIGEGEVYDARYHFKKFALEHIVIAK